MAKTGQTVPQQPEISGGNGNNFWAIGARFEEAFQALILCWPCLGQLNGDAGITEWRWGDACRRSLLPGIAPV